MRIDSRRRWPKSLGSRSGVNIFLLQERFARLGSRTDAENSWKREGEAMSDSESDSGLGY